MIQYRALYAATVSKQYCHTWQVMFPFCCSCYCFVACNWFSECPVVVTHWSTTGILVNWHVGQLVQWFVRTQVNQCWGMESYFVIVFHKCFILLRVTMWRIPSWDPFSVIAVPKRMVVVRLVESSMWRECVYERWGGGVAGDPQKNNRNLKSSQT